MSCVVLSYLTFNEILLVWMQEMLQWVTQNRSRSILHEKLWTKRSLFEIASVFILSVQYVTWCNLHTLKNAKYLLEICSAGWGGHYPCLVLWVLQFASCFTCVWSLVLLLFTISCIGHKCFGVETITNVVWLVYSHLVIFVLFSWRLSRYTYSWCLLNNHVVATVTTRCSGFRFVPVNA